MLYAMLKRLLKAFGKHLIMNLSPELYSMK